MNGLLLDTHVLLWLLDDSPRLGIQARDRIAVGSAVYVSAASTWELAIKAALGKIALPEDLNDAIDRSALRDLPVTRRHTLASDLIALPHKDPFDAVLVAQAKVERLKLLTADGKLLQALPDAIDAGA
ncbi:type II toxin-antitoxin system VapC family toxin [Mycobacterium xenopi]|uniref:Twitching motility protein PilT n=1 Tax=Mycobacterium xenopi TaxID=1789 RepID=A0AAD1H2X9_MYCXE|nr:type II toxin-antitoxin system VapC family toxin [Mycobacterium xenopi]EUA33731.1 PIN domain protein [Mycobacterium xenopi 3993]EID13907.1 twitching motility protein PilT [Mycobacterium xenopi RIVM700367]MDA3641451.1 type II toxin-antitoxin system VapC family toxin [Mycobacterium xenopi]MDA3659647.1 type II toxin-antitoxin system VapC family toxin [Mycobacterium xenopi]MDA3664620.1 type II toxin-antitoxin system VapC family toxin [Mycobacterium xenopi]